MTATFKELKKFKFDINHRKEKYFHRQYTAVVFSGNDSYDAVLVRIYSTETTDYCVMWIYDNCFWHHGKEAFDRKSTGYSRGYGYNRESSAVEEAIKNACIELDKPISGRGRGAIYEAVYAIARAMYPQKKYCVHVTEANP